MPREVFGPDFRFLPRAELLDVRGDRAARPASSSGSGVEKLRLTGGEPLRAPRARAPGRACSRRIDGRAGHHAHDQRRAAAAEGRRPWRDAGLRRVTVSLDALDDATFMAMNDAGVPGRAGARRASTPRPAAGLPVKVNVVVKRGANERRVLPLARHFRGTGHVLRFIEYMDVGATQRLAARRRRARRRDRRADRRRAPARAGRRRRYPGEVAKRWRYRRRRGRDRRHRVGHRSRSAAAAPAPGCRPRASSTPASSPTAGHDLRAAAARRAERRRAARARSRAIWRVRGDRYSELRTAETAAPPEGRDVAHRRLTPPAHADVRGLGGDRRRVTGPPGTYM